MKDREKEGRAGNIKKSHRKRMEGERRKLVDRESEDEGIQKRRERAGQGRGRKGGQRQG